MTALTNILRKLRARRVPKSPPTPEPRPVRFEWCLPKDYVEGEEK